MPPSDQGRSSSSFDRAEGDGLDPHRHRHHGLAFVGAGVLRPSRRPGRASSRCRALRGRRRRTASALTLACEASFSSAYIAGKSFACQASAKRLAAAFSGDPGAPMAAPTTKATSASAPSGSARVSSRLRRSASGDRLLTAGKVIERSARMLVFAVSDRSRLGDRRLHHRARFVGVPAGTDRRRADPGRVRGRARSSAAGSGRWSSPKAPIRPTRRSAGRSGRCWSGRSRRSRWRGWRWRCGGG